MRRLSDTPLGGFSFGSQQTQDQPSLPPIREALSFYYSGPPNNNSTETPSRALSDLRRMSMSPRAANESAAGGHDNGTYTLSSEHDRDRREDYPHLLYSSSERLADRDDRFNQVPRGYQNMPYPPINEQNRSPSGSYIDGTASTTSGVSSPPQTSVYPSAAENESWAAGPPPHRRSMPHNMPLTSGSASAWDHAHAPEPRRYTDSQYPPSGRPSLPLPPYRAEEHPPPYFGSGGGNPPPPYAGSGQHHPASHTQSLSGGSSIHNSYDRAAFPPSSSSADVGGSHYGSLRHQSRLSSSASSAPYHHRPQEYYSGSGNGSEFRGRGPSGSHNSGPLGVANGRMGEGGQRKRRGNLPKETTDKLRDWFGMHLHHPYPTEDEKQELMQQTGLQMNQISNWFINARRRHLPALINNAKAVSGAISSVHDGTTGGNRGMPGGVPNRIDSMRSNGSGHGSLRQRGFYPPADHRYASSDRMYGSFDRPLEHRTASIYRSDPRQNSPGSDDDY